MPIKPINKSVAVLIIAVLVMVLFVPLPKRLCIGYYESSRIVKVFSADTAGFVISYTHSVNKGRVYDHYGVVDGKILLEYTSFKSYGAGMPEPEDGQTFVVTDGAIEIRGIDRELDELVMQTGVIADHHIEAGGESYAMNDIVPPGTRVVIGMGRVSLFKLIREELKQ